MSVLSQLNPARRSDDTPIRFNWAELSGSLGDLGTFLPLALALSVTCGLDLGLIFIFAGLMHIMSGWLFRQPVPVQPMKAIAAVAIAEGLMPGEIAAAGMLMGVLMLALALSGGVDAAVKRVPRPLVRGIQAGVGLKLALTGVAWITGVNLVKWRIAGGLPWWGADSVGIALGAAVLLLWPRLRRIPMLLVIFAAGFVLIAWAKPGAWGDLHLQWPAFHVLAPSGDQWMAGLWRGALPQLPLTLLNSVVAVCALSADYFPGRGLAPRRVAASVGLMNLLAVPFGGMPMCHGSGGLAAQHRFGARTGGSVIMLGTFKIIAGLVFGAGLVGVLKLYPLSILAVMLILAGIALMKPARDSLHGRALAVVVTTAIVIVMFNTAIGVLAGAALWLLMGLIRRLRESEQ